MPKITEQDVIDQYHIYTGRAPTRAEIDRHVGQEVPDVALAARNFFVGPLASGGGGGGEFDLSALLEGLELGLSPEERELIKEQTATLRQQRDLLLKQLRMQDIFGEFQVEQGGYEYVRAPSDFAARQQMGEEFGLPTLTVPKEYKERQKLGQTLGMPSITAPSDKAARETLAGQLGIKVKDLPKAGASLYMVTADQKFYDVPKAGELVQIKAGPMAQTRQTLERELLDQSLKALRGELPVSPTLARGFQDRDQLLGEALRRQLGPGYETSSPGIEALAEERQFQTEATEAARRGELTMAEQFGLGRAGQRLAETASVGAVPAGTLPVIAGFGANAAGFSSPLATLSASRNAANQGFLAAAGLAANIGLGRGELALRSRALDLQNLLSRDQLGVQRDAIDAQRDAALWNAIGTGVGVGAGLIFR